MMPFRISTLAVLPLIALCSTTQVTHGATSFASTRGLKQTGLQFGTSVRANIEKGIAAPARNSNYDIAYNVWTLLKSGWPDFYWGVTVLDNWDYGPELKAHMGMDSLHDCSDADLCKSQGSTYGLATPAADGNGKKCWHVFWLPIDYEGIKDKAAGVQKIQDRLGSPACSGKTDLFQLAECLTEAGPWDVESALIYVDGQPTGGDPEEARTLITTFTWNGKLLHIYVMPLLSSYD